MADCDFEYHQKTSALYDGHGIFLTYVCPPCEKSRIAGFRQDIFERYETDEPIEENER